MVTKEETRERLDELEEEARSGIAPITSLNSAEPPPYQWPSRVW